MELRRLRIKKHQKTKEAQQETEIKNTQSHTKRVKKGTDKKSTRRARSKLDPNWSLEEAQRSMQLQITQTPTNQENGQGSEKKSFRRTRSKAAPNWTLQEMFVLVNEVASIESDSTKKLSSYQKWKHISENCNTLGVSRSLNQCRRKWELLFDQYNRIKEWEIQSGVVSYWSLNSDSQLELELPVLFDKDLFGSIEEAVEAQEERLVTESDTDSDPNFTLRKSGLKKKRHWQNPQESKSGEKEEEMAVKLREQAKLIHAILRGDTECSSYSDMKGPGESQLEFKRWQGSELIKVLGSLVGIIDQVSDLIQDG